MHARILSELQPFAQFRSDELSAKEIVVAGFKWSTDYWTTLAVGWIELGFPIDDEVAELLVGIATSISPTEAQAQGIRPREQVEESSKGT